MERIARFEKISREQLEMDAAFFLKSADSDLLDLIYEKLQLPRRATAGSAGYDFTCPTYVSLEPGVPQLIPTGVRCVMNPGWFLMMVPRSGLGFKYGLRLLNTCGIIDADYSHADNEGHILLKMVSDMPLEIRMGERIAQGIFLPYGITEDDAAVEERHGGFGSTGDAA